MGESKGDARGSHRRRWTVHRFLCQIFGAAVCYLQEDVEWRNSPRRGRACWCGSRASTTRKRDASSSRSIGLWCTDLCIHRVSEAKGLPYLVMPYAPGDSLQKRLDQRGPLELKEILRIGRQVAAGLAAAHAQGLVHRDVTPGNILLDHGVERVTITDFGLGGAADDAGLTRSGVIAGTPQYMSPEQARGEPLDGRSDLFSLGSVLYAMCTGRPPFRAETTFGVLQHIRSQRRLRFGTFRLRHPSGCARLSRYSMRRALPSGANPPRRSRTCSAAGWGTCSNRR